MLEKPLTAISAEDVSRFVGQGPPETDTLEFKEALSGKDGPDGWHSGADRIGEKARNEIVAEVVAFANAHGGTLVLGISETDDKPHRAAGVAPVPRVADLTERLRLMLRDCVEPQLPVVEAAPVLFEDGAGVVLIRVSRSRLAPHRHTATRECYIRRADRCEKMTMREIQDITLQVERGLSGIESRFASRGTNFLEFLRQFPLGFRATLIPLTTLYIERVHGRNDIRVPQNTFTARVGDGGVCDLIFPGHVGGWRPILRGSRADYEDSLGGTRLELHSDGLIEYALSFTAEERFALFAGWWMGLAANAICAADRFRRAAGVPACEYALELEINNRIPNLSVGRYGSTRTVFQLGPFPQKRVIFPRYSIGEPSEFETISNLIDRDFWNAAGHDWDERIKIDFPASQ
jgi:hypothetical protein